MFNFGVFYMVLQCVLVVCFIVVSEVCNVGVFYFTVLQIVMKLCFILRYFSV